MPSGSQKILSPIAMKIKRIGLEDLAIVRDLAMQIWPNLYRKVISPIQMDAILSAVFDLDTLEDDLTERAHIYWVAEVNNKPVGFSSASFKDSHISVYKIYILADYRGLGLGKAMIQTAIDHFETAKTLSLIVPKDHDHGLGFSLKSGFEFGGEEPVCIGGYDLTNYVMHKTLS
jgi:diamine N-acetyltransferase